METLKPWFKGIQLSPDRSAKIIQGTPLVEFGLVETGRYELDGESVVCLSTQVGCAMNCDLFCKSAGGFIKNLRAAEIALQAERALEEIPLPKDSKGIVFSFMGTGEPFANLDNVKLSTRLLGEIYPASRATISTIGINLPAIYELADEVAVGFYPIPLKLHISLHAPNDLLRKKIIPYGQNISDTLDAAEYFAQRTGTKVKLNYVLMKDVNDSETNARELGALLKQRRGLVLKVSDLNGNPNLYVPDYVADRFAKKVEDYGIEVLRFKSKGQDVLAGCGQFLRRAIE